MGKVVIILDDTEEIHLVTKKVLESLELKVICCYNADELVTQILANIHDLALVLLDIYMPDKNGFTVMQQVKDRFQKRKFKIVFFTSIKEKKYILQGMSLKADGYIIKPFKVDEFKEKIQQLLKPAPLF
ncbi:response regulator [Silvanigrella paludirubra]|uniref:Response regulator n=1 Tax=Silvanigrella paludirubra TaxID=2499159 RepID=A0A6N6VXU3_9BACT|nr:response regulator [Silvanigrella paludirubra]KAB8040869.1 response regulator [Silvanigrella paludirubra]